MSTFMQKVITIFTTPIYLTPRPRAIRGSLVGDGRTLLMEYPLTDGTYVSKQYTYPDAEMAQAGYQRFMRDVADNLPGHSQRKHLRAIRLNKELIEQSHLSWKISEEPDYGRENTRV